MPNWCNVTIEVMGPQAVIAEMWDEIHADGEDDLMRLHPMPKILEGTTSPAPTETFDPEGRFAELVADPNWSMWTPEYYEERRADWAADRVRANKAKAETGHADWYSWCVDNWGTKWATDVVSMELYPERFVAVGSSPWGPPAQFCETLSRKYPVAVVCSYSEAGMDFVGACLYVQGHAMYDQSASIQASAPEPPETSDDENEAAWDEYYEACLIAQFDLQEQFHANALRLYGPKPCGRCGDLERFVDHGDSVCATCGLTRRSLPHGHTVC